MKELKVGDRVRLKETELSALRHQKEPAHYPKPGTVGVIREVCAAEGIALVDWPKESGVEKRALDRAGYAWWAPIDELETEEENG